MTGQVTQLLVIAGACVLIASFLPIKRIVVELPAGPVRRQWHFLSLLIFSVACGYLVYGATHRYTPGNLDDIVVPIVFLLGACFVFVVNTMSLQTAHDVRRIAVLEYENITDPFMGIYNRRYLDRRLKEEVARAQRHHMPLSILLLDIDKFKPVNDTWGHPVGDLALTALGKLISEIVRSPDVVARYGGEEIMVIAPDTPIAAAMQLAERTREVIQDTVLVPPCDRTQGTPIQITVSIGVASLERAEGTVTSLLQAADAALYEAKSAGRNRVCAAPEAAGEPQP